MDWTCSQEAGNDTSFSCSSQNQLLRVDYCRHERKHQHIYGSRNVIIFEWTLENVVEKSNTPTRQHATFIETHCLVFVRVFVILTHHSIQPLTITFPIPEILFPLIVSYNLLLVPWFQNNAHLSQQAPSFCSRCNCASCIFLIKKIIFWLFSGIPQCFTCFPLFQMWRRDWCPTFRHNLMVSSARTEYRMKT